MQNFLGNVYSDKWKKGGFGGDVWDIRGIAPSIKTGASVSQQCVIVKA